VFGHAISIVIIPFIVDSENSEKLSKNNQKVKQFFKFRNFPSNTWIWLTTHKIHGFIINKKGGIQLI